MKNTQIYKPTPEEKAWHADILVKMVAKNEAYTAYKQACKNFDDHMMAQFDVYNLQENAERFLEAIDEHKKKHHTVYSKKIKHDDLDTELRDRMTFVKTVKPKKAKNKVSIVETYENKKALEIRKKSAWKPEAGKHPWKKKMPELDKPKRQGSMLSQEKEDQIVRLLKAEKKVKEISIITEVSEPTIYAVAKRTGTPVISGRRGRKPIERDEVLTDEDDNRGLIMSEEEETEAADVFAGNKVDEEEDHTPESE